MKILIATLATLVGWLALHGSANADRSGFEYAPNSDLIIFGGSSFYSQSRDKEPENIRTLYSRRVGVNEQNVLFQAEGALTNIQASPQGDLIGVLEVSSEEDVSEEQANYVARQYDREGNLIEVNYNIQSTLRVINLQGELLASLSDVRHYTWDPSGTRVAYLTGTEYEGGFGFLPTGAWVYDVAREQAERIHSGGYDIEWAVWDGNIYIYDGSSVIAFDPSQRDLIETSHQGIYFSPDGRYYFAQGYEATPLRVFETESDDEVAIDLSVEMPNRTRQVFSATGWLDTRTLIVPTPFSGDLGDYLYDIEARAMWQANGTIVPVRQSTDDILVLEGSSVSVVENPRTDLRLVR